MSDEKKSTSDLYKIGGVGVLSLVVGMLVDFQKVGLSSNKDQMLLSAQVQQERSISNEKQIDLVRVELSAMKEKMNLTDQKITALGVRLSSEMQSFIQRVIEKENRETTELREMLVRSVDKMDSNFKSLSQKVSLATMDRFTKTEHISYRGTVSKKINDSFAQTERRIDKIETEQSRLRDKIEFVQREQASRTQFIPQKPQRSPAK